MQPILKAGAHVQRKYEKRREYRCRTHIKLLASQQGVNLNQEKAKDTNLSFFLFEFEVESKHLKGQL